MTGLPNSTPEHLLASDRDAGFEIGPEFERFDQMNDMFTRAMWDPKVQSKDSDGFFSSYRMEAAPRRGEGFAQRDFALRNAAWIVSDVISNRSAGDGRREGFQGHILNDTPVAADQVELRAPEREASEIKRLAKLFGADLCGITHFDLRWHYTRRPDTRDMTPIPDPLPEGLTHVIVMGHAMDFDLVETYPSALAGAATGLEYSHETAIVLQLAAYIRNLGFDAVPSMNDSALVIPYAIKAGLGEYGRNQMVLTPEFGPRVRFSKIFTNMPLAVDKVRELGLSAYCLDCTICADACPVKALPDGKPQWAGGSPSTIKGVRKWSANCEACFGYWVKLKSDCAICMRVCPFNNRGGWRDVIWCKIARSRWRALARWWAEKRARTRTKPRMWWNEGGGK